MKTFQVALVAMLLLGLHPQPDAEAGILTGGELVALCEPAPIDPLYRLKISECTGYIAGVADTFDCTNKTLGFRWDSTKFAGQELLVKGVMAWFHLHPNVLHYQASGLVASALEGSYPCKNTVALQ